MTRIRMEPEARRAQLFEIAWSIASKVGLKKATRLAVAREAKVSKGLVSHHFGNREELRGALIEHAVSQKNAKLVAEAIEMGYEVAAPRSLLRAAAQSPT